MLTGKKLRRYVNVCVALLALAVLFLTGTGCAQRSYLAGYRVEIPSQTSPSGAAVAVSVLYDSRPTDERTGDRAGLLNSSTYDTIFVTPVDVGITQTLIDELRSIGMAADSSPAFAAPYQLDGTILNYRAVQIPPRSSFIPYLSYATWMWTNDIIAFGVQFHLRLRNRETNEVILSKLYTVQSDTEVWVGFLNLRSRLKGFTREDLVQLLHQGLRLAMTDARQDIHTAILNDRAVIPPAEIREPERSASHAPD